MRRLFFTSAAVAAFAVAVPAQADTLRDALIQTYKSNPTLTGARARLRATDEDVGIARSQGRPQLSGDVSYAQSYVGRRYVSNGRRLTLGADVSLPVFQGGRVRNSLKAADARVDAGRAELRTTEGNVFVDAVSAYMDVIRDGSIVDLNRLQVKVLDTNLQAARDRFQVGDLTRTDVAQSEARLASAQSQLATAEGRLTGSRESYRRIIGSWPTDLAPPPPLPALPQSPDAAVKIALANNPEIESATAGAKAARYDVGRARGGRLPTVSTFAGISRSTYNGGPTRTDFDDSLQLGVRASVPFYQGGLVGAQVRQAQAFQSQALERTVEAERFVIADTRGAYASYIASVEAIRSSEAAVSANTLALEGVRAENSAGTRTVLDVLNAEQELLNSQVSLVVARRDAYVAGFALLDAMGQAEMRDLGLDGGPLYDPVANYRRVRGRITDFGDNPKPVVQATRTVDPAMQGPPDPRDK